MTEKFSICSWKQNFRDAEQRCCHCLFPTTGMQPLGLCSSLIDLCFTWRGNKWYAPGCLVIFYDMRIQIAYDTCFSLQIQINQAKINQLNSCRLVRTHSWYWIHVLLLPCGGPESKIQANSATRLDQYTEANSNLQTLVRIRQPRCKFDYQKM
jgi:hypothetical protein